MPSVRYQYNDSTFNSDAYIETLNREIRTTLIAQPQASVEDKQALVSRLLRRACSAAFQGANRKEGGPFGALIVDFEAADGMPKVVGFGTNHVVPNNDPSAHAEMTAIRDAAKRLGKTDFSNLTLVTSCECCPMCLATATGTKLKNIFFAATRDDAANVGFSDAAQYELMRSGGLEKHAEHARDPELASTILGTHDAVVIVRKNGGKILYYGDDESQTLNDPSALPTVQAIRKACAGEKTFHLPEDTVIISRKKPHPLSLIVAAWARIGAVRDPQNPDDPAKDHPNKDASKIRYVEQDWEVMSVSDGKQASAVPSDKVWEEINKQPDQRDIPAIHTTEQLGRARNIAFERWDQLINKKEMPRY